MHWVLVKLDIALSLDKGRMPGPLEAFLRQLHIVITMSLSVKFIVCWLPIRLTLVSIIKPMYEMSIISSICRNMHLLVAGILVYLR